MVRRHQRVREPGWQRRLINGVRAATSGTVLVVMLVVSKFTHGHVGSRCS